MIDSPIMILFRHCVSMLQQEILGTQGYQAVPSLNPRREDGWDMMDGRTVGYHTPLRKFLSPCVDFAVLTSNSNLSVETPHQSYHTPGCPGILPGVSLHEVAITPFLSFPVRQGFSGVEGSGHYWRITSRAETIIQQKRGCGFVGDRTLHGTIRPRDLGWAAPTVNFCWSFSYL